MHARHVKARPLVDQTRLKFADVRHSGSVNFLLQHTTDAVVRSGEFGGQSIGGMKSGTFRSRKPTASLHRPVERQNLRPWDIRNMSGKKIVAILCPIHFDTWIDKMDFNAALEKSSFKRYVKI